MSIEQLKTDLKDMTSRLAVTPLDDVPAVVGFLRHELLAWLESLTEEIDDIDNVVESVVSGSEDKLGAETGGVFAAIIASGLAIATELSQRAGNDARILGVVREFRKLAKEGEDILNEIVIDDEIDDDEEESAPEDVAKAGPEGKGV